MYYPDVNVGDLRLCLGNGEDGEIVSFAKLHPTHQEKENDAPYYTFNYSSLK